MYRILSLSGGGTRGVFQARLLEQFEADNPGQLYEAFDLVAATSTGALVGLAVAAGIPMKEISSLYTGHARTIFRPKALGLVRPGGRYHENRLLEVVRATFGNRRLSDLRTQILVATSTVDTFEGRVFTKADAMTSLVEVAMATCAAPTYFPPVKPSDHARAYMDGGLWANDPSHLALLHALYDIEVEVDDVNLVALGSGRVERGVTPERVAGMRTISTESLRFLFDFTRSLQGWSASSITDQLLPPEQRLRIDPHLTNWIALDDADQAITVLPALADSEYEKHKARLAALTRRPSQADGDERSRTPITPMLRRAVRDAHLTRFIPSRRYYSLYREGRETITSYVSLAVQSLTMVSISLPTGDTLEGIVEMFEEMVNRPQPVTITVSLLDPELDYLAKAIAPVIDLDSDELRDNIRKVIGRLSKMHQRLDAKRADHFKLWCHNAVPNASAIMIDEDTPDGLIQLETKPYRASLLNSFAFEVQSGSEFYATLQHSYQRLIADARLVLPAANVASDEEKSG